MFISTIFLYLITLIIYGFSYLYKRLIYKEKVFIVATDFIYGIVFITFFSIIINFFFSLIIFKYLIFCLGIFAFVYATIKKIVKINHITILLILILFSFFTHWNGNNADSPVYHFQTINWIHDRKITFGLAILDWHYALNSIWHIFLSSVNYKFQNYNTIYNLNILPIIFLILISVSQKGSGLISLLTIRFSVLFLIIFSLIHPFKNGIILNHLGNPEVDTVAMSFFIFSGYLFLLYFEEKNEKFQIFNLLIISSTICFLTKLGYISVLFFPIIIILSNLKIIFLQKKIILFSILFSLLWTIRNFILSSCLIFPIKNTCFNTSWSLSSEQVEFYLNQTHSFARDTRLREKYTNFDYTINSNDWIIPWINDYVFNDAFLIISLTFTIISLLMILIKSFKNLKIYNFLFISIIFTYLFSLFIWFKTPEIRFGWGIFIFYTSLFFVIAFKDIKIFKFLERNFKIIIFILCISLATKNFKYFKISDIFDEFSKNFDYSEIVLINEFNGIKIYKSLNWQCADFKQICINKPKNNYFLDQNFNYLIIKTNDYRTF